MMMGFASLYPSTNSCFARRANVSQSVTLYLTPKSAISMRHPVPTRGALAIVMNAGRDAVDVGCFLDERSWPADGKAVWSWHPDAGVKFAKQFVGDGG
jgi:hypothetical protein